MINHARTLLLNQSGVTAPSYNYPGEEYISPSFSPITLSADLQRAQLALFGANADRAMLNWRTRELLTLIHDSELDNYITKFDPRISYTLNDNYLFRSVVFGINAIKLSGSSCQLYYTGDLPSFKSNIIYNEWKFTVVDSTNYQIECLTVPSCTNTGTLSFSGNVSNIITLPGTSVKIFISDVTAPYPVWMLRGLAKPAHTINEVFTAVTGLGQYTPVFGTTDEEPFITFKKIFRNKRMPFHLRLASWTLAYIYRLNVIRQAT